jgi:hypothetical protein
MVVEIYHRDGTGWNRCVFHAGGILEAGPSPYTDEKGKTECPIVAQSCYVDRENNRMGVGRDLRSPQDEFNKRRSKLLHETNNRQMQAMPNEMGQMALGTDADLVRQKPHARTGLFLRAGSRLPVRTSGALSSACSPWPRPSWTGRGRIRPFWRGAQLLPRAGQNRSISKPE